MGLMSDLLVQRFVVKRLVRGSLKRFKWYACGMQITAASTVKWITRGYFLGALAASSSHAVVAAEKAGLTGWEAWSVPVMVDGMATLGLVMRGESFASDTRRMGFRVQMIMACLQVTLNVFAAHNVGGMIYGVAVVGLYVAAETLAKGLRTRETEQAEKTRQRRSETAKRAAATRKANAQATQQRSKIKAV